MSSTTRRARSARNGAPSTGGEPHRQITEPEPELVRGGVSIAESVVAKIAATAARKVPGIYPAGTGAVGRALGVGETDGIRARIRHDREVSLEMRLKVDYGEHIPTRGAQVRAAVARAIRELTNLEPREIKVKITDIQLAEVERVHDETEATGG